MHFENNWEKKLIDKARQVVESGWGEVSLTVSANGRRLTTSQKFTEVSQEKPLQSFKKGV